MHDAIVAYVLRSAPWQAREMYSSSVGAFRVAKKAGTRGGECGACRQRCYIAQRGPNTQVLLP
eukprot:1302071-Lingulodinium_polyedra.AAC.1